jgi:hypothetical protein
VGQRFIVLLSSHPYFKIHALGASARSAGQAYIKATKWKQSVPIPQTVREMVVKECKSSEFAECDIVFSGLDHDVAGPIGKLCQADIIVLPAKSYALLILLFNSQTQQRKTLLKRNWLSSQMQKTTDVILWCRSSYLSSIPHISISSLTSVRTHPTLPYFPKHFQKAA